MTTATRSFAPPAALRFAPGLALAAAVAAAATAAARLGWLQANGISALTLAIVIGVVAGNLLPAAPLAASADGLNLAKQWLLRGGIALYGLRLTFQDIGHVGLAGVAIDAAVLSSTFALACVLGTRVFGLDRTTAILIGAGSSICGAAAAMATAPVVRGKPEQVAVAVATVVGFGTVAIFLYPALFHLIALVHPLSAAQYGLWAGSTIHEVAQVVAAGHAVGDAAADTAVIAKLVRVMMLAPFLVALSAWLARTGARHAARARAPITIPWFALGFVAAAGLRSLDVLPAAAIAVANTIDIAVLAIAMAALGLTTRLSAMKAAGLAPLGLGATLFAWLVVGGGAINWAVQALG
ncbi:YeiH family protein [Scleromatobacter humisilvae]|uniref:YeiH family protein n=1 Tax=Scleromatobacter humisilvae TaxID=2897159 RepID=A0A9X2C4C8_9BURK|nr:YeiH family protein [Scleromatobacter humisilvae]MCK9689180.1 YeiH family protein [Scleromatobacter humisilvae]